MNDEAVPPQVLGFEKDEVTELWPMSVTQNIRSRMDEIDAEREAFEE